MSKTLSEALGGEIYYRYPKVGASGTSQELVLIVSTEEVTISIEGGRQEAATSMTPEEIRSFAGVLLDAADAVENSTRTGFIKPKR